MDVDEIEEWRPVKGSDLYEVSDLGNIRRVDFRGNTISGRQPTIRESSATGRAIVRLGNAYTQVRHEYEVASLVGEAFFEDFDPALEWIGPLDGDTMNCAVANLRRFKGDA